MKNIEELFQEMVDGGDLDEGSELFEASVDDLMDKYDLSREDAERLHEMIEKREKELPDPDEP